MSLSKEIKFGVTAMVLCFIVLHWTVLAQQSGMMIRLTVDPEQQTVAAGTSAAFKIRLLDPNGKPVPAPRDVTVSVENRAPSGRVRQSKVVITRGHSEIGASMPVDETGLNKIRASAAGTLEGGAFVYVRAGRRGALYFPNYVSSRALILAAAWQGNSGPAAQTGPIGVSLEITPEDGIRADGKDAATITAALENPEAVSTRSIRILLNTNRGVLSQQELVIPPNEYFSQVKLTSDVVGDAVVTVVSSPPTVKMPAATLKVHFVSPITGLSVDVTPKNGISLLQTADIMITLPGDRGAGVEEPWLVNLVTETGHGIIREEQVTIPAGHASARAKFIPTSRGAVSIQATSDKMLMTSISAPITVTIPASLILCTILGGICGGALGYWWRKPSAWSIPCGAVLGFLAFWAVLYQIAALIPAPLQNANLGALALNPVTAVAVSIIGGAVPPVWLGARGDGKNKPTNAAAAGGAGG